MTTPAPEMMNHGDPIAFYGNQDGEIGVSSWVPPGEHNPCYPGVAILGMALGTLAKSSDLADPASGRCCYTAALNVEQIDALIGKLLAARVRIPGTSLVALRDSITAAIDAPRLAPLTAAAADRTARGVHLYTAPQPFTFASALDQVYLDVSDAYDEYGHIADEFTAKMEANRDAIEARLTEAWDAIVVEFGLHVELADEADPPDIEIAPPPAPVDPREAEASALWLTQPVRCAGNVEPPCGWSGVGADITERVDEMPCCPKCEEGVCENILAPPPPRYVVGTVGAAPDGAMVAVFAFAVSAEEVCARLNAGARGDGASRYSWRRADAHFRGKRSVGTPCIIDTAASQSGEG